LALAGASACAVAFHAAAQQASRLPRIGVLGPAEPTVSWFQDGFREGLAELGYVEGKNLLIDYRWAHGRFDRLPGLASELLGLNLDLIVAQATQASLAAKEASATTPIVMVGVADPVGVGLVSSLARPDGNVTGTSNVAAEIVGKQFELITELDPKLTRVGVLWNPANAAFQALQLRQAKAAARAAGPQLQLLEASSPTEFDGVFNAMRRDGTRALLVLVDPLFSIHRTALLQRIAKDRVIAVSGVRDFAEAGGLLAYGPSYRHSAKRAAFYVDRILKGAKPSELPIEQPTAFELVINMRTAQALGLTIPPTLLARAVVVIE
jgi:putative ABC transport system substrate-binding protein